MAMGKTELNNSEIFDGVEIIDLCLYVKEHDTLIVSDVHIGYEECLNKQGIFIPRFQYEEIVKRFIRVIETVRNKKSYKNKNKAKNDKISKIIFNGDIKHEFGAISKSEWNQTLKLLDLAKRHCNEIILVKGNHDTILGPIADKSGVEIVDYVVLGDVYVCHGDKIPKNRNFKDAKTLIIGHEHPAVSIRKDGRSEVYKCFMKGKYRDKTLIVMPSFNLITEGTDVSREALISPFLNKVREEIKNFEVYITAESEVFYFGRIDRIRKL